MAKTNILTETMYHNVLKKYIHKLKEWNGA